MDIKEIIDSIGNSKENIIPVLLQLQKIRKEKYIRGYEIKIISKYMNIPESRIMSILSFYSALSLKRRGKYIIQVCSNVPCYVNGSINVLKEIKKELNIDVNETTDDNMFTLEYSGCLGCCDKSPVIRIDEKVYGNINATKLRNIINFYRNKGDQDE